jgi:hypothetical protein
MQETEMLRELIDLADISVRVASQLRLRKKGRVLRDRAALESAVQFLDAAAKGGMFLSGQGITGGFDGVLRPLNWATDTYIQQHSTKKPFQDYSEVATYLNNIKTEVASALASQPPTAQLENAILFFEKLGELLSARADQSLQARSYSADFDQTAIW